MGAADPNTAFVVPNAGLPATSAVVVSGNTTLDLSDSAVLAVTIGSLSDAVAGATTGQQVLLGANTLTTGADNTNTTFSGNISGAGGWLVKVGAGTFTLSGSNSYSGSTSIQGGILALGSSTALPAGAALSVSSATLNIHSYTNSASMLTLSSGAIIGGGALNVSGTMNIYVERTP